MRLPDGGLLLCSASYVENAAQALLLCVDRPDATAGETFAHRLSHPRIRTVTYVLAASVYCTAWTFYGSVGLAANRGLEFLTIYLGPACIALLPVTACRKSGT